MIRDPLVYFRDNFEPRTAAQETLVNAGPQLESVKASGSASPHPGYTSAHLAAILHDIPIGVALLSSVFSPLIANDAFYAALGVGSQADLEKWGKEVVVRDRQGNLVPLDAWPITRALRSGDVIVGSEMLIERPNHDARWVLVSAAPVRDIWRDHVAVVTLSDITANRMLEEERRLASQRIVDAKESERKRVALELHDDLGQSLTLLSLELSKLAMDSRQSDQLKQIQRAQSLVEQLGARVHHIAWSLRPMALDQFGLKEAVEDLVESWSEQLSIQADVMLDALPAKGLRPEASDAIYRVIQEALTNVAKHSKATSVAVVANRKVDGLRISVEDDGHGFDIDRLSSQRGGIGLVGMRERIELAGGALTIDSSSGNGTAIFMDMPLEK